jgi:4-hydroxybenzoate polyprenyltransferase
VTASPAGTLRAYLELVRLPNLFTAAADVLAGYLTVAAVTGAFDGQHLTYLLVSTVCLYAGGVALNDYFDEPVDRVERPERPLPSGRVSRSAARRLVVGLFVMACLTAASVGPVSLLLALAIVFAASLYDAVGKRTAVGPLNMGLCRFLNFLLGVSASPELLEPRVYLAFVLMVHVIGVTLVSRGEVSGGTRPAALLHLTSTTFITLGLVLLGFTGDLPNRSFLVFLAAFVLVVAPPTIRALSDPTPRNVGLTVKWGVLGLVLLDATFAAAFAGWPAGLAVAALLLPSILTARLFAVT